MPADAKPYWSFKEEIHEADGILLKNHKMIVPEQLRPEMLKRIHEIKPPWGIYSMVEYHVMHWKQVFVYTLLTSGTSLT